MDPDLKRKGFLLAVFAVAFLVLLIWQTYEKGKRLDQIRGMEVDAKAVELEQAFLAQEMKKWLGSGTCQKDYDCRVLGIGVKRCGKYRSFIVFSSQDSHVEKISSFLEKFNQNAEKLTAYAMQAPPCGVAEPEVQCVHGKCETRKKTK